MAEKKLEVVVESGRCRDIVSDLLTEQVLAVDCEGIQLGVEGPLTLLQVGTYDGDVYLFDIQENRKLLSEGCLGTILESIEIVKVMHACTNDSAALFHQFNVTLKNVFDTQVADVVLEEEKGRLLAPVLKLQHMCEKYSTGDKVSELKEELKTEWSKRKSDFWAIRPLTDEMLSYASGDVKALIPEVYVELKSQIEKKKLQTCFQERVLEAINISLDPEAKSKRLERVQNNITQIIDSIDKDWEVSTKLEDLPEDGNEIRALKRIDLKKARKKSKFIDRLKTESIQIELKELRDELDSTGSDYIVKRYTLSFLSQIENHRKKAISKEARHIKERIHHIILDDIETKYQTETNLNHITRTEKEVLRTLTPKSTYDDNFPRNVLRLYWILMEEDLDRKCDAFEENRKDFKMKKGYYQKMKFFVAKGTDVPGDLKQKARRFKRGLDAQFGRDKVPE
ncbi:piRNA biogenesis protein EXD1-like [Saccostrea echinata]|uniref:piRNA biogenesis protein EXD1-like n=1 Tax=Saccostrea echinata TaxID=191078 RepID=UPI002A7F4C35|nr:piRNA biogenesis protein EXD1-like [Saccostrea echinata]